jgi:hypothetical protein
MSLATIFEVPMDPIHLQVWSFAHAAHHLAINQAIFLNNNISLPSYVLDPFNPQDPTWFYQHQDMHQNQDQILKIPGFDLTDVNWQDRGSLEFWITQHANEHYQAGAILGID